MAYVPSHDALCELLRSLGPLLLLLPVEHTLTSSVKGSAEAVVVHDTVVIFPLLGSWGTAMMFSARPGIREASIVREKKGEWQHRGGRQLDYCSCSGPEMIDDSHRTPFSPRSTKKHPKAGGRQ